ncbi:MAG: S1 RNA-binding domain-containing protein [Anaerolineae bacterium]|nr:S1 RNA-binding domain-containing protein [Anaerolineae bacterium]MCO5191993.1 S1 RNA-binding domain-containing protein [Anaerolineae bacterium]MCO5206976.1 S1 RNA-binding domain-containing protein [Anaerolineae bacterium]
MSAENETIAAPQRIEEVQRKTKLTGTVTRTELYGAFIDIGVGVDAVIHISQLGDKRVNRVSDALKVGDEVTVWVDKVDPETNQIIVSMNEPLAVEWDDLHEGQVYTGKVVRLENFGAFVDIGAEKEGLVHVSELAHDYIKHPSQAVNVGDEVQVKVLGASKRKRRINLSVKALTDRPVSESDEGSMDDLDFEDDEIAPTAMEIAFRQATGETLDGMRKRDRYNKKQRYNSSKRRKMQDDVIKRTLNYSHE